MLTIHQYRGLIYNHVSIMTHYVCQAAFEARACEEAKARYRKLRRQYEREVGTVLDPTRTRHHDQTQEETQKRTGTGGPEDSAQVHS